MEITSLEKAIAESKEREEKATKAPWRPSARIGGWDGIDDYAGLEIAALNYNNPDNSEFIAASRTWEPVFREMVELAMDILRKSDRLITDGWSVKARDGIRELITELERLAKEGLGE